MFNLFPPLFAHYMHIKTGIHHTNAKTAE